MTHKTIYLPEDLFYKLEAKKQPKETIPNLIRRLIHEEVDREKAHQIMDLAGALGEDSDEWDLIEKELYVDRFRSSHRGHFTLDDKF